MQRYVLSGCCTNPDHCSNRRWQGFKCEINNSLEFLRKNFKDFLFFDGKRNVKVLDPSMDIRGLEDKEAWTEDDPYHPQPAVYKKIADSVIHIIDGLSRDPRGVEAKRRRTDSIDVEYRGSRGGRFDSGPEQFRGCRPPFIRSSGRAGHGGRGRGRVGQWSY
jgi:hypothetical protein